MTLSAARLSPRPILILTLLFLIGSSALFADAVHTKERTVTQVAPGIYMIRHKDTATGFPNGNTEVIIGDHDVLVVDSCFLPSEARQDIAQIREWTSKPVRYLVNTHVHNDHTMGNGTYTDAFPGLLIIAQTQTKIMIEGYLTAWYARHLRDIAELKQKLATGKGEDGKPLTEAQIEETKSLVAGEEAVTGEMPNFVPVLPNLTFENELNLDLGNREVQIKYLGHGNTPGDAVLFLPKEKILITGDIVVHPVPYQCSGYPAEWSDTLQRMIDLNPEIVLPGHGEMLHGTAYMMQVKNLLTTIVNAVRTVSYHEGNDEDLEFVQKTVEKSVDIEALRRQFDGGDKDNFSQSNVIHTCLVRNAYYEEKLR
jgi:cyclase